MTHMSRFTAALAAGHTLKKRGSPFHNAQRGGFCAGCPVGLPSEFPHGILTAILLCISLLQRRHRYMKTECFNIIYNPLTGTNLWPLSLMIRLTQTITLTRSISESGGQAGGKNNISSRSSNSKIKRDKR